MNYRYLYYIFSIPKNYADSKFQPLYRVFHEGHIGTGQLKNVFDAISWMIYEGYLETKGRLLIKQRTCRHFENKLLIVEVD